MTLGETWSGRHTDQMPHRGSRKGASVADEVTNELGHLAARGVDRAFEPLRPTGVVDVRRLSVVAELRLPELWSESKPEALRALIEAGSQLLGGQFGKITEKDAVALLFDLHDREELVFLEGKRKYREILNLLNAESAFQLSDPAIRERLRTLRSKLAYAILRGGSGQASPRGSSPTLSKLGKESAAISDYVRRDSYHRKIAQIVSQGAVAIAVVGPPGVGKDRLVAECVSDIFGQGVLGYVDFRDETRVASTLVSVMASERPYALFDNAAEQLMVEFMEFLYSPQRLKRHCLVLRNPPRREFIDLLQVHRLRVAIVVVSDYLEELGSNWRTVRVDEPEAHEAIGILENLAPRISRQESQELVGAIGRSPQVLDAAATLLSNHGDEITVRAICDSFESHGDVILRHLGIDLVDRYNQLARVLRQQNSDAADLLERLAVLGPQAPVGLLIACVVRRDGFSADQSTVVRALVERNLQVLALNSLVERNGEWVRLHALARLIGASLLQTESGLRTLRETRSVLIARLQSLGSHLLSPSIEDVMTVARAVVNMLYHVELASVTDGERVETAGRAVAAVLNEVFGSLDMGALVSVSPFGYGDNFVMNEIRFTVASANKADIASLALARLRLGREESVRKKLES